MVGMLRSSPDSPVLPFLGTGADTAPLRAGTTSATVQLGFRQKEMQSGGVRLHNNSPVYVARRPTQSFGCPHLFVHV